MTPETAAACFDVPADRIKVRPHGKGNINDTYLAVARSKDGDEAFILQRIIGRVFRDPDAVMSNMRGVSKSTDRSPK